MDGPVALFKKRSGKAAIRKSAPPPRGSSDSSSTESEGEGRLVKRRKTGAGVLSTSTLEQKGKSAYDGATKYDADRSTTIEVSQDATKQSNWYDESGKDALSEKNLLGTMRTKPQSFIQKNANAPDRKMGPMKAPTNVRTITITDYAPDVCKDYKQTGFCGFGDNCKYLHAREDYAHGWQLDKEWEMSNKGKKPGGTTVASANRSAKDGTDGLDDADAALLEKIPFACVICKKSYKNPIVTKCGHYFCESCALQRYRKTPNCAACGSGTNGVFNGAKNLQKLLDRKREREKRLKDKAREEGKHVSDNDEEDEKDGEKSP